MQETHNSSDETETETEQQAVVTNEDRDEALENIPGEAIEGTDPVFDVPDDSVAPDVGDWMKRDPIENVDTYALRARADPDLLDDEFGDITDENIRKSLVHLGVASDHGTVTTHDYLVFYLGSHPDRDRGLRGEPGFDADDVTSAFERINSAANDARERRERQHEQRQRVMSRERDAPAVRVRGAERKPRFDRPFGAR